MLTACDSWQRWALSARPQRWSALTLSNTFSPLPTLSPSKPRHDLLYASASLSRLGIARANPRLAAPVFYPTIGPCTTLCSVLCLRRGSHAEQSTGGLAHRERPPAQHPGPAP